MITIDGTAELRERLRDIQTRASDITKAESLINANTAEQWRALPIPILTGLLARILRSERHPKRVVKVVGGRVLIGTKVRQGRYQRRRIGKPKGGPMLAPLADWIMEGKE